METTVRSHAMLCAGTGCMQADHEGKAALEDEFNKKGIGSEAKVVLSGCNGFCAKGPVMSVYPDETFYQDLTPEDIPGLVEEHFLKEALSEINFKEHEKKVPYHY